MTIALITGGSRGIGGHLVRGFLKAGYRVALTATRADPAKAAAAEAATEVGSYAHGFALQVGDAASVAELAGAVERLESETGDTLGVIVNNAGVIEHPEGPVWGVAPAELARTIDTNVLGPFLMVQVFAPLLIERAKTGGQPTRIIDLNSGSGSVGSPQYAAYSASKAALFRLADSVHHYGYDQGLRIFEMAPGVVRSDMTTAMPVHSWRGDDDWTNPADVTGLAVALASGELDGLSGRFVRAGVDSPETLRAELAAGLATNARRLILG